MLLYPVIRNYLKPSSNKNQIRYRIVQLLFQPIPLFFSYKFYLFLNKTNPKHFHGLYGIVHLRQSILSFYLPPSSRINRGVPNPKKKSEVGLDRTPNRDFSRDHHRKNFSKFPTFYPIPLSKNNLIYYKIWYKIIKIILLKYLTILE